MGEIDRKAKWTHTKEDQKGAEGEGERDEGRTKRENWTEMGLTADQKEGGSKTEGLRRRGGRLREQNGVKLT